MSMSSARARIVALLGLALALAAGGCGFHMQGATALPAGIQIDDGNTSLPWSRGICEKN